MLNNFQKKSICFYFQVHQPTRLSKFRFFDIESNNRKEYFEGLKSASNEFFIKKVGKKSYYPANNLILKLLNKYPEFKVSYSISGVTLEQFELFDPKLIESFQALVKTKKVELLNETYYHSLSWLHSKEEFAQQIILHRNKIWQLFKKKPNVFRNTELIYNNELGEFIRNLGFKGILAEGWDYYLEGKSPNYIYEPPKQGISDETKEIVSKYKFHDKIPNKISLLLKNYKLSDDVAFRFSNKGWSEYPLTVEKFVKWIAESEGDTVNLFMDYETFGEHQWEDSGIFKFLEKLPGEILKMGMTFKTPSETIDRYKSHGIIDMHNLVSWADIERDISAWAGNKMQKQSAKLLYQCEKIIRNLEKFLIKEEKETVYETWRKLQTSDHFYYMSTKYWNDGDIHKYFSPYDSPYDAYINYMNILTNFKLELSKRSKVIVEVGDRKTVD